MNTGGEYGWALVLKLESSGGPPEVLVYTTFPRNGRAGAIQQLPSIRVGGRFDETGGTAWLEDYDVTIPAVSPVTIKNAGRLIGARAQFYLVPAIKYKGAFSEWKLLHEGRVDKVSATPDGIHLHVVSLAYYAIRNKAYPPYTIGELDPNKVPIEPGAAAPCAFGVMRAKGVLWGTGSTIFLLGDYTAWPPNWLYDGRRALHKVLYAKHPEHPGIYLYESNVWNRGPTYVFRSGHFDPYWFTGEIGAQTSDLRETDLYDEKTLGWLHPHPQFGMVSCDRDAATAGRNKLLPTGETILIDVLDLTTHNPTSTLGNQFFLRWRYKVYITRVNNDPSRVEFWCKEERSGITSESFVDDSGTSGFFDSLQAHCVDNEPEGGDKPPLSFGDVFFTIDELDNLSIYAKSTVPTGNTTPMVNFYEVVFEAWLPAVSKDIYIEGAWRVTPHSDEQFPVAPQFRIWDDWPYTGSQYPTENPVCIIRSILCIDLLHDRVNHDGMLEAYRDLNDFWGQVVGTVEAFRQPFPMAFQVLNFTRADEIIGKVCKQAGLIFVYDANGANVKVISPYRNTQTVIDRSMIVANPMPEVRVEYLPDREIRRIMVKYRTEGTSKGKDYIAVEPGGFSFSIDPDRVPDPIKTKLSAIARRLSPNPTAAEITVDAPYIQELNSAFFLLVWTYWWRKSARRRVSIRVIGSAIDLRPGDYVRLSLPEFGLSSINERWLVESVRINPQSDGGWFVDLDLLEVDKSVLDEILFSEGE